MELALKAASKSFPVKLPVYDGPLDLLLDLIKKNEMDICDIQISVITQQYLDYLATLKELDLEIAGEFIVMAATLIYIKSKMLLPPDDSEEDEEGGDPRAELVRKLLEYQAFKAAAKELGILEGERSKVFTRQVTDYYLSQLDESDLEIDTFSANLYDLLSAFQKVIAKHGKDILHEVFEEEVSIEERMSQVRTILEGRKKILFAELFENKGSRNFMIVTFLAVLEIVRTKFACLRQEEAFGDIAIEKI